MSWTWHPGRLQPFGQAEGGAGDAATGRSSGDLNTSSRRMKYAVVSNDAATATTRRASPVVRCVPCLRAVDATPPMWPDAPASLRQPIRPSALCLPEISSAACTLRIWRRPGSLPRTKRTVCLILLTAVGSGLRTQAALQIENAALRHQLAVLQRQARGRPRLRPVERLF